MKKIRNIILIVLGIIVSLNILVVVLLNIPFVQQKVIGVVVSELQKKIDSELSIGRIHLNLLRGVSLDDVFLADQKGDTLLYISSLTANTSLFHVFQNNTLRIDELILEDFKAHVSKDSTNAPFNFQFLIDAFSSGDTTKKDTTPSLFDLTIRQIELRNGDFRYAIFAEEETPGLFNASRIHVRNLNGELSLGSIQPDRFNAKVYHLSAEEQSGFDLKNLRVQIHKDRNFTRLDGFLLDLPDSRLKLSDVWFDSGHVLPEDTSFMKNGIYHLQIEKSEIVPKDLRAFYPPLSELDKPLKLEGFLHGSIPSLEINKLTISYDDEAVLTLANASMSDWGNYRNSDYKMDISQFFLTQKGIETILRVAGTAVKLPDVVQKLGNLQAHLTANGKLERLQVDGHVETVQGNLSVNGNLGYDLLLGRFTADATLSSNSLNLQILDSSSQIGRMAFNLHTNAVISQGVEPDVQVSGTLPFFTFRNYVYRQIAMKGTYRGMKDITAMLRLEDENVSLNLDAKVSQTRNNLPEYQLNGSIHHFNPHDLHLTDDFEGNIVGTDIRIKVQGDKPENITGKVQLDNFYLVLNDSTTIEMDSMLIKADRTGHNENILRFISPYLNAHIQGVYNPATLMPAAQNILHGYLPTFFNYTELPENTVANNFSYSITLKNAEPFLTLFHSPVTFNKKSSLRGEFRENSGEISLHADFPELFYGKTGLEETVLCLQKRDGAYAAEVRATIGLQTPIRAGLITEMANDTLSVRLKYDNSPAAFELSGEIQSLLSFRKEENGLTMNARFLPSDLTVNDLHIGFKPAEIEVNPERISIDNFGLTLENDPFLEIDGTASASSTDTLQVFFKQASIASLLGGLDLAATVPVNGYLNGSIYFSKLLENPRFYTRAFRIDDITYGNDSIGSVVLNSRWNEKRKGMNVGFSLMRSGSEFATASGFVSPIEDLLQMNINMHSLPIEIAQPFLDGILHNLHGYCGADLKIDGKIASPDIRGYIYLQDASATVDRTSVTYQFSDTVRFTPTTMDIKNWIIHDNKNNSARFNCAVKHNHFSDFTYSGSLQLNNLLVLNNPTKVDSLFFGRFFANGNLSVKGDMRSATVSGNLRNGNKSTVTIRLPESASQANTYRSIVFLNSETTNNQNKENKQKRSFSIKAKVGIELTKEAEFGVVINPSTGDELLIQGSGNISADFDSDQSGIRLFGQYTVDNGSLKMRLSQFPQKTFTIQQGSRVNMNGDPMMSTFDITASYRIRTDLNTLDAAFATLGLAQTRVPVDCILHIQGSLNKMNLTYEITLPDSDEDINRMVNNLINTDDLRIKQFAYLVAFGSFFPPNSQLSTGNNNVMTSLAASSLSSVLNNSLSGILGENVTLGTDLGSTQSDFSDLEMNVFLSTQLFNDRLTINTNVGYRNNTNTTNDSPWIGDFDLEYKLTKSGSIRAKAFSHTNNEIFRSSNTIQGIGLVFTREGRRFKDLLPFRRKTNTAVQPENDRQQTFKREEDRRPTE